MDNDSNIYWRALKYQTNLNFEISFDRNKFFMNNALSKEDLNNKPIRPEVLKCPTDSYLSKNRAIFVQYLQGLWPSRD